ncbi:MAG: ATP-binding protein [Magnetovibrionaceae bacterium]
MAAGLSESAENAIKIILALAVVMAIGVAVELRHSYSEALDRARDNTRAATDILAEHTLRILEATDILLLSVIDQGAFSKQPTHVVTEADFEAMVQSASHLPQVRSIWFAEAGGRMSLFSGKYPTPELNISDRDYFSPHLWAGPSRPKNLVFGNPIKGKFTGKYFFSVSRAIRPGGADSDELTGVVTAAVEPIYFERYRDSFGLGPEGAFGLARRDGTNLTTITPDGTDATTAFPILGVLQEKLADDRLSLSFEDGEALYQARAVGDMPIFVWSKTTLTDALSDFWDFAALVLAISAIVIVIVSLTVLMIFRQGRIERAARLSAEEASAAKTHFLSVASHELRTPLTSLAGSIKLLNSLDWESVPEKNRELLVVAERNAERLALLINDILDMNKIISGQLEIRRESFYATAFLRCCVGQYVPLAAESDVALSFVDENQIREGWDVILGDESRLEQVMANLLSNAVKFSPKGGEVTVAIAAATRRTVSIEVRDQGPGVPREASSRIFEPFRQADVSDRRSKSGTGLGLSISKSIIEMHDGVIAYRDRDGGGAIFSVTLPILDPETHPSVFSGGGAARRSTSEQEAAKPVFQKL